MTERLSFIQLEALQHVKKASKELNRKSKVTISDILARAHLDEATLEIAIKHIQLNARVVLHFHPDRLNKKGKSVAESLLQEGFYRNQFETGISNGGLTAFQGGERDNWEKRLFGGVYQKQDVTSAERPKYGALDLMNHADGPSPRFGSCYFRLSNEVSKRCSFTYKDSFYQPEEFGTIDDLTCIMASMLGDVEKNGELFGVRDLTVSKLISRLSRISNQRVNYSSHYGRTLDDYIEAQVHGPIDLKVDAEVLVADPSFQTTGTGKILEFLCAKYDIELDWHAGFKIHISDIPSEFRGPKISLLAQRIAGSGFLNTAMIGNAAVSLSRQPELWRDWGTYDETLQHIKQLWHVLAYYGQPLY